MAKKSRMPHTATRVDARTQTDRNVRAIAQLERAAMAERTHADRLSDSITHFAGSATFVAAHAIGFTAWIGVNVGMVSAIPTFDPFPFSFLTLVVSLEAIFLAIFVLMSQSRMARLGDRRAQLDLQIDLLAERENTLMLHLLRGLCEKQGVCLSDFGPDENALLAETDVTDLATDLDRKLSAS